MAAARELGKKAGADLVLFGSFKQNGEGFALQSLLVPVNEGQAKPANFDRPSLLSLNECAAAMAGQASGMLAGAAAAALRARLIGLHGHAHEILLRAHGARALTARAGLGARAGSCAAAVALVAVLHAGDRDLLLRTEGRLFKRQLNTRADVVALHGGAGAAACAAAAAAEKAAENIAEVAEIAESGPAERAAPAKPY